MNKFQIKRLTEVMAKWCVMLDGSWSETTLKRQFWENRGSFTMKRLKELLLILLGKLMVLWCKLSIYLAMNTEACRDEIHLMYETYVQILQKKKNKES